MTIQEAVVALVCEASYSRGTSGTRLARIRRGAKAAELTEEQTKAVLWACQFTDFRIEQLDTQRLHGKTAKRGAL